MCYFCFDVLYCHLYNLQPPQVNSRLMALCINGKWIVVAPFRTLSTLKLWILTAANKLQQCRVSSLCHLEDWKGPEAARWDHTNLEMIVPEFSTQSNVELEHWIITLNTRLHWNLQWHGVASRPEGVRYHLCHEGLQVNLLPIRVHPCSILPIRFSPMTREEFPGLQVSVSVLCNFEVTLLKVALNWSEDLFTKRTFSGWSRLCRLGAWNSRDQDRVPERAREQEDRYFFARGFSVKNFSRLYQFDDSINFTQVPTAQGWDKIQTIDSLLRKGGWRGQVLKFCGKANFHLMVHLRSPLKFVARSDWSDTSLSWSLSPTKTTCNTAGNLMSSHSQFCWFGAHCTTSPGFFQFVLVGYITTSHYRGTPPRSRSQGEHWQEFPAAQAFQVCVLHSHFLILLIKCSSDVVCNMCYWTGAIWCSTIQYKTSPWLPTPNLLLCPW